MVSIKFIGLALYNQAWNKLRDIVMKYHQYVELSKCESFGALYDTDPHITLYYCEANEKGPNWMYWLVTTKLRDLYSQLLQNKLMKLDSPKINTFKNDDAIVVKFDMTESGCNILSLLKAYHHSIESHCPKGDYPVYKPHITVTYLKPTTPEEIVTEIINEISSLNLDEFKLTHIMLGGGESNNYQSSKLPIE